MAKGERIRCKKCKDGWHRNGKKCATYAGNGWVTITENGDGTKSIAPAERP